jgi:predicted aconitase with swiveling domain
MFDVPFFRKLAADAIVCPLMDEVMMLLAVFARIPAVKLDETPSKLTNTSPTLKFT